jgi:hypothetical protein
MVKFGHWRHAHAQLCSYLLFIYEAHFTRNGMNNALQTNLWAVENPHTTVKSKFKHRLSINVWCGIIGNQLIWPYAFSGCLTMSIYLLFSQN